MGMANGGQHGGGAPAAKLAAAEQGALSLSEAAAHCHAIALHGVQLCLCLRWDPQHRSHFDVFSSTQDCHVRGHTGQV